MPKLFPYLFPPLLLVVGISIGYRVNLKKMVWMGTGISRFPT